jgi:large subunit ribosomal protein L25
METIVLAVEPRVVQKRGAEKLRKNGQVPAIVYHKGEESTAVSVNEISLDKLVHSSESHIIDLQYPDGRTKRSFIKNIQFHPVTDRVIHADFQLFSADEIIEMAVPTAFEGECPGVKIGGGKIQVILHSLTLKGKPEDMPEHFVVDLSELQLGHTLHIRELPLGSLEGKVEILGDPDAPVVSVLSPRKEVETPGEETPSES